MDWDTMVSHLCFVAAFTCMYWLGYSMLLSLCAALLAFFVLVFVLEVCKMTLPNFLSSIRIRATKPFILNDWIKTNIEGYEVSGTVKHVGWWWTTVTAEDGGTLFIPNHKFTDNIVDNIVRNPSHWCIKIYIPISPLGVNKIDSIVADMRQVLAKNPQVEQKTVFLEDIHPEKQDLKILISCFVETSHYEEYLSVKHAIILDLLEVVDHHQAWLAATNRTVDGPLCRNDCTSNW